MVSLQSRSTFCYICRIACTDILLTYTYLIRSLLSQIYTPLSPLLHIGHIGTDHTRTSHLYRSSVYYSVGCGCFLTPQHHWMYHFGAHHEGLVFKLPDLLFPTFSIAFLIHT